MKNLPYLAIIMVVMAFILGGCRSSRQVVEPEPAPQGDPIALLKESYVPWSFVEMPVRFELRSPKKFSVSGTAKMIAGEAVQMSFRFFGMEMANVWLTADSVQVVVKPMSVYFKDDIASLTAAAGITIDDIQSLMMGRVFEVKPDMPFEADFYASFNGEGAAQLDSVAVTPNGHKRVVVNYGAPDVTPCGPIAKSFGSATSVRGHDIDFTCRWDVESAKWNSGKTLKEPKVPSDFRRLSATDIINILKKL